MKVGAFGVLLKTNRDVRNLWCAESISNFGDFFYDVAIMWLVYQVTGSAAQSGFMLVASFLPQVAAGPLLGAVADRVNPKRLMMLAGAGQASLMTVLGCLIAFHTVHLWEIYVVTVLLSLGQLVYAPARSSVFPDIVRKSDLITANALFSSSQQMTRIVGSVAGGTLMAFVGPTMSVALNALSFIFALLFIRRIRCTQVPKETKAGTTPSLLADMKQGWAWLWDRPVMLLLILIGTVSNIALGPTNVMPPKFIQQALHGTPLDLGVFDACIGFGIVIGGVILGSLSPKRIGLYFTLGLGLQGLAMAVVAIAPSVPVACAGNFLLGVAVIVVGLPMSTMFQVLIPASMRGRINATSSTLFNISVPITYGGIGLLGDAVGSRWCYGFGTMLLALCLITGLSITTIRKLNTETPEPGISGHESSMTATT